MKTAIDYIVEQLWAPCRGVPSHIIEEAKKLEKKQINDAYKDGCIDTLDADYKFDFYYDKKYNVNKLGGITY